MTNYPLVRFVDAPSVDAVVRFDFNEAGEWATDAGPEAAGWSIGVPSFTGDPGGVGAEYGYRRIEFMFNVHGERFAALRTHSRLAREVLRADNWLLFQLDAFSKPVWFKTYRTQPGDLSFDNVYDGSRRDMWRIGCAFDADAFAYGERVTLDPVTIANDPVAASNPCHVVLPEIEGDAPTNLRVEVAPSQNQSGGGYRWLVGSNAAATALAPTVWQIGTGDGFTAGTDTGAGAAGAAYSGGSYREVTFATDDSLVQRIDGQVPTNLKPGRYRAFVRVERQGASSATYEFQLGQETFFNYFYDNPPVRMDRGGSSASHATWVDLGDFQFPRKVKAPEGERGLPFAPTIALKVGRLSGSAALRLDAFMLLPVDVDGIDSTRTLYPDYLNNGVANTATGKFDGDYEDAWILSQFGTVYRESPELAGAFPTATPGMENTLNLLLQVGGRRNFFGNDSTDSIAATSEVTVSYHPRHLYIGGE